MFAADHVRTSRARRVRFLGGGLKPQAFGEISRRDLGFRRPVRDRGKAVHFHTQRALSAGHGLFTDKM